MTESNAGGVRVERQVRRVLYLTLKKKWFDMIASGVKREEYREMKPYWNKRLMSKKFDAIQFRNGYSPAAPTVLVELKELLSGLGIIEWGAPAGEEVFILRLGEILSAQRSSSPDPQPSGLNPSNRTIAAGSECNERLGDDRN